MMSDPADAILVLSLYPSNTVPNLQRRLVWKSVWIFYAEFCVLFFIWMYTLNSVLNAITILSKIILGTARARLHLLICLIQFVHKV